MELVKLHGGTHLTLWHLVDKNREPEFRQFIDELRKSNRTEADKTIKFLDEFVKNPEGFFHNNHKWKLLRKPIYELKATNQVRLFAFVIDENNVGITHGYIKKVKTDKRFQLQIDKAIDYYKRWRDEQHRESAGNA